MKKLFLWLVLPLLFSACNTDESNQKKDDFNLLMGSNTPIWKWIETPEDYQNLSFFKDIYEKNKHLQMLEEDILSIPKVIHFIWIGPNPFPPESVQNIYSWVEHHPNWIIKFWTDQKRPLPHPNMKMQLISHFHFESLGDYYEDSDNYAEKSDLLRYEILHQEGGLYVDHDVKCFKPFSTFHYNFDFYCGLEPLHQPILSSSISVGNNLIGTVPRHPILKKCIEYIHERWRNVALAYPGNDKHSIIYRVVNRSFSTFEDAVKEIGIQSDFRNIVFPAAYFNRIDDLFALFAHHYYATTWFEDETKFERNVRRRLMTISRKNNQILLFNAVILSANLVLFGCLVFQFRNLHRFFKKK